ncbi:Uncharacterised protein [Vibrio cholerae]|nr:Uncharacterised protein [Vibrio cholerae]CSI73428.1 Uncharacterised protein [Vibrio cholerae]
MSSNDNCSQYTLRAEKYQTYYLRWLNEAS